MNPKRRAKEWARAYGSKERVSWVQAQPSCVSGKRPCENVHVITGGMGRKSGYQKIVPLTPEEHQDLHRIGRWRFEFRYDVNLELAAVETELAWLAHLRSGFEESA